MGNDCELPARVADAECRIPLSEMQVLEDSGKATESFFRSLEARGFRTVEGPQGVTLASPWHVSESVGREYKTFRQWWVD